MGLNVEKVRKIIEEEAEKELLKQGNKTFMNPATKGFGSMFDEPVINEPKKPKTPNGIIKGEHSDFGDLFDEPTKNKSR